MPNEDQIALALFVMVVVGQLVATKWNSLIPKIFRRKEWILKRQIAKHRIAMESLNSTDKFAAYSKSQRELAKLEKELEGTSHALNSRPLLARMAPYVVSLVAQLGFVMPAYKLYHRMELVMVPNFLGFGYFRWVGFGSGSLWDRVMLDIVPLLLGSTSDGMTGITWPQARGDEWVRSIGVVTWCVLSYVAWRHIKAALWR